MTGEEAIKILTDTIKYVAPDTPVEGLTDKQDPWGLLPFVVEEGFYM